MQFTNSTNFSRGFARRGLVQGSRGTGSPLSLSRSARAAAQSRATSADASVVTARGAAARSMTPEARAPVASIPAKATVVAETAVSAVLDAGHEKILLRVVGKPGVRLSACSHASVATSSETPSAKTCSSPQL